MPLNHEQIRKRREAMQLSQQAAADLAKMTQPSWARVESGARDDPNLSTAERMAGVLKCTVDDLLIRPKRKQGR